MAIPRHVEALLGDSARYALSKAIPGIVGFASVILFVRLLGEDGYGRFALAFSVAATSQGFFLGWLNQAVLRYESRIGDSTSTRTALRRSLLGSLALGGLFVGLGLPLVWGGSAMGGPGTLVVVVVFGAMGVFRFRMARLQARLAPCSVVQLSAAQAMAGLVIPVALLWLLAPRYEVALAGLALSYCIGALWPVGPSGSPSGSLSHAVEARQTTRLLWAYGWALSFWFATLTAMQLSDRYFIQRFLGFAATGEYSAIHDVIVRGYSLVLFPITLAAHPLIMRAWNEGDRSLARSYWLWSVAALVMVFPVLLLAGLLAGPSLPGVLLPSGGAGVTATVLPLVVGGFLWQLALVAHKPLEVAERTGMMLACALFALAINVVMNATLMPRFGVVVAAWSLVVTGIAYTVLAFACGGGLSGKREPASTASAW